MTPRPIRNCSWIAPGQILAGEYPRDIREGSAHSKLGRLTQPGMSAIFDLTLGGEFAPTPGGLTARPTSASPS